MKLFLIALALIVSFGAKDAYTAYAISVCVTDTECQDASGEEI